MTVLLDIKKLCISLTYSVVSVGLLLLNINECTNVQSQEFKKGSLSDVGIDSLSITDMHMAIAKGDYPNIHSVLIFKDELLVYEEYFSGNDENWGKSIGIVQHSKERLHDVRSISKSIVSACIGLAIEQGKIESVQQKVFDFFREYNSYNQGEKSNLTINHLLTMTAGLKWNEDVPYDDPANSETQMAQSSDPVEYALSQSLETEPGNAWEYNGGTSQILAAIIKKTTGYEIDRFAEQYLFNPIGIKKYEWIKYPENGYKAAASGLRLRSRDLMKLGILYLNKGKWQGKQVISEEWINKSTKAHNTLGRNNNVGYGYDFWILDASTISQGLNHNIIAAFGNGDQRIYIDYEKKMVVVVTAGNYNNWNIKKDSEALLINYIYPSLQ